MSQLSISKTFQHQSFAISSSSMIDTPLLLLLCITIITGVTVALFYTCIAPIADSKSGMIHKYCIAI